jgi:hypothetical protein
MTFHELIQQEEELLKRLLLVSQRQLEIVRREDVTGLIQHLGQRQQLWNEFEQLEEQLKPHRIIPPEHRIWESEEEHQQVEESRKRCELLLQIILANDDVSIKETAEQKDLIETQLRRVQQGANVIPAYVKQTHSGGAAKRFSVSE